MDNSNREHRQRCLENAKKCFTGVSCIMAFVAVSSISYGASLVVGSGTCEPGDTGLLVPVSLVPDSDENVVSAQFDLLYDTTYVQTAVILSGPAATESEKTVDFAEINVGRLRIVVFGMNQIAMPADVIVLFQCDIADTASPGEHVIALDNTLLSDPSGRRIPCEAVAGAILIEGSTDEGSSDGAAEINPHDVSGDGHVNSVDVQLVINTALGLCTDDSRMDFDSSGAVNAVDVQIVINVALGLTH